jgi:hypothetical protein
MIIINVLEATSETLTRSLTGPPISFEKRTSFSPSKSRIKCISYVFSHRELRLSLDSTIILFCPEPHLSTQISMGYWNSLERNI